MTDEAVATERPTALLPGQQDHEAEDCPVFDV